MDIVLNIGRYTGISADIPIFHPKRYDTCKNLPDIVLDQYRLIYRHVADISTDIRDEISDISVNIVTYISVDIVTYLDNYFFCLRDHFILFYVHCDISMMFLFDVWIITYFF